MKLGVFLGALVLGLILSLGPVHAQDIQIHGFISQGYMWSDLNNYLVDSEDGSAEFNEAAINFQGRLSDNLRAGIQLFAKDQGDWGNNRVTLDWAYGDYRFADWFGVRFGRVKRFSGLYGEIRDFDMLRVPILLPQGTYYDPYRELTTLHNGVNFYGSVPVGDIASVDYQLWAGENSLSGDSDIAILLEYALDAEKMDLDDMWGISSELNTNFGLRLAAVYDFVYFKAEGESEVAPGMFADTRYELKNYIYKIYSIEYVYEKLTVSGEYHVEDFIEIVEIPFIPYESRENVSTENWYVMAAYQVTDKLAGSVYYHEYYPSVDDKDGEKNEDAGGLDYEMWHKEWCASLRYDINDYWLFKVEGHSIDGMGRGDPDKDGTPHQHWSLFAVKTTFTF
jgi:hypothetical protein